MSYVRVSITGTSIGTEVWSINPVFDPTGEIGTSVDQAALDAACLAIATLVPGTALRQLLSTSASRVGARVEVRDDATDDLIALSVATAPSLATGTETLKLPLQAAVVTSLRTTTPGASGRGRLYWPAMGATLDSQGRMSLPTPTAYLTDMKAYLGAIETALEAVSAFGVFNLAVRSRTTHTTPHVTRLQAGNIIDTQRRRRDAQPESYVSTNYP